ncbi:hypothetical protein E5K00_01080 [Hymenobacter aquaticus]|uniref:Gingipain domain-containing protein n=1 Tax=Hymenobacter aquaticus TaxID=1867101 RepID=A0A4Z0Q1H8_9BACT|nr:C25 family cysteine peptidase [Hymenobacter aquaticus]TGE23840.1 hypothetical protein E5K00_01080 [Hymenobacter aquaticus]
MSRFYRFDSFPRWFGFIFLLLLLTSRGAQAQSGPYGNEWLVPGQAYYKIKVDQDGLYRLDYQYLTRAGLGSTTNPQRLQLWRRGREVAIYVGGTSSTGLDATSYVEFYGQRNDGALDKGMYKNPAEQAQRLYSLYTDTAAYFLTVSATANGKRMAQPALSPVGGKHPYWIKNRLFIRNERFAENTETTVHQPWGEAGEGFMSYSYGRGTGSNHQSRMASWAPDTLSDMLPSGGPSPRVEMLMTGSSSGPHELTTSAQQTTSTDKDIVTRPLGPPVVLQGFEQRKLSYPFLRSDVYPNGRIGIITDINNAVNPGAKNWFRMVYLRLIYPSASAWPTGRREVSFSNDSTLGAAPAFYQLDNIPASVCGYDVTDPYNVQRIVGVGSGLQRTFVFPNATAAATRQLLLTDLTWARVPPPARRVQFRTINPAAYNYLIVTSPVLMKPTGTSADPVRDYAAYRAARFTPLIVTSEELYDQFHYGEKSALAIRQFALYMLTNPQPKYLLLLGQGISPQEVNTVKVLVNGKLEDDYVYLRSDPERYRLTSADPAARDLVPTSTRGSSDAFFTADWPRNDYAARMATGRIAANTPADVLAYLTKLRQHESQLDASLETQPWRKNALNLLGAQTEAEYARFALRLDQYKAQIEKRPFAGKVVNSYGTAGIVSTKNIAADLNAGLSLITYFGHGQPDILQLDLGDINNPSNGYNNVEKYPVMFVSGCAAGNTFRGQPARYAQQWLLADQKGLVGLMAESDLGGEGDVHTLQTELYDVLLNDAAWYGKPVAEAQSEAVRRLQRRGTPDPGAVSSWMNTVWHADPALRLYSPLRPDFAFGAPALEIRPDGTEPVRAKSASYKLLVRVKNPGKATGDKLDFRIQRQYDPLTSDNRPADVYFFRAQPQPLALGDTTYTFVLPNPQSPAKVFGTSIFTVTLDDQNKVAELDETNNQASTSFSFLQEGITLLNPPEFAIVTNAKPRLVGQTNDPLGPRRTFLLEADTTLSFSSPLLQRTSIQAALLADWRPTLPVLAGRDSVVWYWRMRFESKLTPTENTEWVTSSFRVIPTSLGGWSQAHHGQFSRSQRQRVEVAAPSGKWSFSDITKSLTLQTRGGGSGGVTYEPGYGIRLDTEPVYAEDCGIAFPNLLVAVYDGNSLRPLRSLGAGPYDSCGTATNRYYHFARSATDNINTPARQAQLLALLNQVPTGAYVALVSINKVDFSSFSPALKTALTALGSQKINQLQDGDPYALFAHKTGGAPVAQEATADVGSTVPRAEQVVSLRGTLATKGGSGVVTSPRIGPAQQWTTLVHTLKQEPTDSYTLRLLGIAPDGTRRVLNASVPRGPYSLNGVSAKDYPYLQLEVVLKDTLQRTAPQLRQLLVTYQGLPEGIVRRDSVVAKTPTAYDPTALAKQVTDTGYLTVPVIFQNVSGLPFGTPLKAVFTLRNATKEISKEIDLPALGANGTVAFDARISAFDLYGSITGTVTLNAAKNGGRLPEVFYFNNELTIPAFQVEDRSVPPVLDVAFDGQHILNGDIVSPRPTITVLLTDEDKRRPGMERSAFDLVLTYPNKETKKVDLNAANVRFTAEPAKGSAQVEYEPGRDAPLADGLYTLEVQGRDASGRAAGAENYRVGFEVVNASSISHVFPYPNPITRSAQFVFTLTGEALPRNLKIQILTLTGKVVRQILMAELGPLRIGTNVTAYHWDGTDEYGDRLANGTYLYRVVLDDAAGKFEQRATAADKAFKNNWGKLVLLR